MAHFYEIKAYLPFKLKSFNCFKRTFGDHCIEPMPAGCTSTGDFTVFKQSRLSLNSKSHLRMNGLQKGWLTFWHTPTCADEWIKPSLSLFLTHTHHLAYTTITSLSLSLSLSISLSHLYTVSLLHHNEVSLSLTLFSFSTILMYPKFPFHQTPLPKYVTTKLDTCLARFESYHIELTVLAQKWYRLG